MFPTSFRVESANINFLRSWRFATPTITQVTCAFLAALFPHRKFSDLIGIDVSYFLPRGVGEYKFPSLLEICYADNHTSHLCIPRGVIPPQEVFVGEEDGLTVVQNSRPNERNLNALTD